MLCDIFFGLLDKIGGIKQACFVHPKSALTLGYEETHYPFAIDSAAGRPSAKHKIIYAS
jgi:hypothetical protein